MKSYQELADKWIKGSGEEYLDVNPADKDHVLARIRLFTKDDVKEAINKALSKFEEWSKIPPPKRSYLIKGWGINGTRSSRIRPINDAGRG